MRGEALEDGECAQRDSDDREPHMESVSRLDRVGAEIDAEEPEQSERSDEPKLAAPQRL